MAPIKDENLPPFLRNLGFHVVSQPQDPASPGSMVVLQSDKLRVRFAPNSGIKGAQLATVAQPDRWWDLPEVLGAMDESRPAGSTELTALAATLRQEFPAQLQAFLPRLLKYRHRLEQFLPEQQFRPRQQQSPPAAVLNGVPVPLTEEKTGRVAKAIHLVIWILLLLLVYLALRR